MASIISAGTTSGTALNMAGDTSGELQIATNGSTTAITIDTSQRAAFVAGTAAAPAITTTGDTNTGIFFPAADTIAFAEGGAEAMRITSAGVIQANASGTGEVFAQNTVKVWGAINAGAGTLYNSFGASSISKVSTGVFTVNFSRTFASARFGMAGSSYSASTIISGGNESTTSTRVQSYNDAGTLIDSDIQFLIAAGS